MSPLVDWKPCLTPRPRRRPPFDLWVVNQKLPFMSFSHIGREPMADGPRDAQHQGLHGRDQRATAARKGIADGDQIILETPDGRTATGRFG